MTDMTAQAAAAAPAQQAPLATTALPLPLAPIAAVAAAAAPAPAVATVVTTDKCASATSNQHHASGSSSSDNGNGNGISTSRPPAQPSPQHKLTHMHTHEHNHKQLTRNERKRRFREEQQQQQTARLAAASGASASTSALDRSNTSASSTQATRTTTTRKKPLRMPASAFLPCSTLECAPQLRRCVVAYDGAQFQGFQAQDKPGAMRTVQEVIEDALLRTTGERLRLRAASRTDAGVHALGQVIAFASRCSAPDRTFRAALNSRLPDDVVCRALETLGLVAGAAASAAVDAATATATDTDTGAKADTEAEAGAIANSNALFDPRAHSKRKTYAYRIASGGLRPVLERQRVWFVKSRLDVGKMRAAAALFLQPPVAKDYASFTPQHAAVDGGTVCSLSVLEIVEVPEPSPLSSLSSLSPSPQSRSDGTSDGTGARASDSSSVTGQMDGNDDGCRDEDAGQRLEVVVTGDRFLYKMVRNLVGTLVDVGLGRIAPESIPDILAAKSRAHAGQGAPPHGLTLVHIAYD